MNDLGCEFIEICGDYILASLDMFMSPLDSAYKLIICKIIILNIGPVS